MLAPAMQHWHSCLSCKVNRRTKTATYHLIQHQTINLIVRWLISLIHLNISQSIRAYSYINDTCPHRQVVRWSVFRRGHPSSLQLSGSPPKATTTTNSNYFVKPASCGSTGWGLLTCVFCVGFTSAGDWPPISLYNPNTNQLDTYQLPRQWFQAQLEWTQSLKQGGFVRKWCTPKLVVPYCQISLLLDD